MRHLVGGCAGEDPPRRPTRESAGAIGADDGGGRVRTTMSSTTPVGPIPGIDLQRGLGFAPARCHVTLFGSDCGLRFKLRSHLPASTRASSIISSAVSGAHYSAHLGRSACASPPPPDTCVKLREIQLSPHAFPVVQVRQHARVLVGWIGRSRKRFGALAAGFVIVRGVGWMWLLKRRGRRAADGTGLEGVGEVTVRQLLPLGLSRPGEFLGLYWPRNRSALHVLCEIRRQSPIRQHRLQVLSPHDALRAPQAAS